MKNCLVIGLCVLLAASIVYNLAKQPFYAAQLPQYENSPEKVSPAFVGQFLPPNNHGVYDKVPTRVDAHYIHAFLVCNADIQKAGIGSKSDISNYEGFYFWEDKRYYYVIFMSRKFALKQRPGRIILDGEKILGQDTKYLVRKSDFSIASRTFVAY